MGGQWSTTMVYDPHEYPPPPSPSPRVVNDLAATATVGMQNAREKEILARRMLWSVRQDKRLYSFDEEGWSLWFAIGDRAPAVTKPPSTLN